MPWVERFGSTTVWAKTRLVVPLPLSYPAHFSPHSAGSMSIFNCGEPLTITVSLKVNVTRMVSPSK